MASSASAELLSSSSSASFPAADMPLAPAPAAASEPVIFAILQALRRHDSLGTTVREVVPAEGPFRWPSIEECRGRLHPIPLPVPTDLVPGRLPADGPARVVDWLHWNELDMHVELCRPESKDEGEEEEEKYHRLWSPFLQACANRGVLLGHISGVFDKVAAPDAAEKESTLPARLAEPLTEQEIFLLEPAEQVFRQETEEVILRCTLTPNYLQALTSFWAQQVVRFAQAFHQNIEAIHALQEEDSKERLILLRQVGKHLLARFLLACAHVGQWLHFDKTQVEWMLELLYDKHAPTPTVAVAATVAESS